MNGEHTLILRISISGNVLALFLEAPKLYGVMFLKKRMNLKNVKLC